MYNVHVRLLFCLKHWINSNSIDTHYDKMTTKFLVLWKDTQMSLRVFESNFSAWCFVKINRSSFVATKQSQQYDLKTGNTGGTGTEIWMQNAWWKAVMDVILSCPHFVRFYTGNNTFSRPEGPPTTQLLAFTAAVITQFNNFENILPFQNLQHLASVKLHSNFMFHLLLSNSPLITVAVSAASRKVIEL